MRIVVERVHTRILRATVMALMAATAAGCGSDVSRFDSSPFDTASRTPPAETTGSVRRQGQIPYQGPVNRVESRPISSQPLPPPETAPVASRPATAPSYSSPTYSGSSQGVSGGGPGLGSYRPASQPEVTGTVQAPRQVAAAPAPAPMAQAPAPAPAAPTQNWSWSGGTAIIVGSGDTLPGIARRYGVPASAIMQANNLTSASALKPGQRLVIPRYNSTAPARAAQAPEPAPAKSVAAAPSAAAPRVPGSTVHTVKPGETLMSISRTYNKPFVEVAKANGISPQTKVSIGDRIVIPGGGRQVAAAAPAPAAPQMAQPAAAPAAQKQAAAVPQKTLPALPTKKVASAEPLAPVQPAATARVVTPAAEQPKIEEPTKAAEATGSMPTFRWPARGRVITAFGPKTNGQQNDGINLAVPEGTPVKAAEDGVVAYSGNELKGYGNLVLVRHPNGYVTAYAHASELMVRRGDTVKRGQTIAKAGQTGSVSSPQLHFEIRKGAAPVDPMPFLGGT